MKTISVNLMKEKGKIKPLHGVNGGPLTRNFTTNAIRWFKYANIPYSRLHDVEGTYGVGHFVDIEAIFKDFSKDANDPDAYEFKHTDLYLDAIKRSGSDIIYRLGPTIENASYCPGCSYESGKTEGMPPMHINPPKDPVKWAKVCEGIIRHYNEGWANGFHMNIKYWEIWNEPESAAMWTGTLAEFNEFYTIVSKYLKERFPDIKIGGYGSIGFYPETRATEKSFSHEPYITLIDKIRAFLTKVKEENAPLDFFSWHLYSSRPYEYMAHADACRKLLDEFGFTHTESILDEWNNEFANRKTFDSASSLGAILACMQNSPVDIAAYYATLSYDSVYNGMFTLDENKKYLRLKGYHVFKAFGLLYQLGTHIDVSCDKDIFAVGAKDENECAVLISNYNGEDIDFQTKISDWEFENAEVLTYLLNDKYNMEMIRREFIDKKEFTLYNNLKKK